MTNVYWQESYSCIRRLYPDAPIVIVDDNSSSEFLTDLSMINCTVVKSEYPGRGEILAYYYFWKLQPFDTAIIIHDSTFIYTPVPIPSDLKTVKFLWDFEHKWDIPVSVGYFLGKLKVSHDTVCNMYNRKNAWKGCFGLQSVIQLSFLNTLVDTYGLFDMISEIKCRDHRCTIERVFAILCHLEDPNLIKDTSIFGNIHRWQGCGYSYSDYLRDKTRGIAVKSVVKVWTGR